MFENMDVAAILVAFVVAAVLIAALLPFARTLGLMDAPEGRKRHAETTPVVGGIAMLLGCVAGFLVGGYHSAILYSFIIAALLVVAIGVYDDRHDVAWYWRIGLQAIAALIIVHWGGVRVEQIGPMLGVQSTGLGVLSVPFTVFAMVGLINALNMTDGSDGLCGSLSMAALVMLAVAAFYAGNDLLANRSLVVAGAVAGFLLWNLRFPWRARARTFMGDAGSGFLGLVIAWVAFRLTQNPGHPVSPVLALWLVPIPVMDCLVLIFRRVIHGRSPFAAGRDHIHHLMFDAGFKPMGVVAVLTGFSLLTGLLAGLAMKIDVPNVILLLAYLAMCVGWFMLTRRRARAVAFFRRLAGKPASPLSDAAPALKQQ